MNKTTTVTSVADTENLPEHMGSSPILLWGSFGSIFSFYFAFSFGHCIVCTWIYDFSLHTLISSTFLRPVYHIDVLSLNNSRFGDYLHRIYLNELEVKDTNDTQKHAFNLELYLEIDDGGRVKTKSTTNAMTSLFQ
jgi:hypothetical protein